MYKPKQTLNDIESDSSEFIKKNYLYLLIYFLVVILSQFFINSSIIINKCGGSISKNIATSALMTFIPWVFIFGSLTLILIAFPGFKSAFSNVIGYFSVSSKANEILAKLLVNNDIQKEIDNEHISTEKKQELQSAAEAIIKLCGNVSIMINQIVPENFIQYWDLLKPLIKQKYIAGDASGELLDLKQQLLNLVITRDNIGEGLWYFYTGLLLISIVQYKIVSRPCVVDPQTMAENHQKFLEQENATLNQPDTQAYAT